jgi:hypothetical protein
VWPAAAAAVATAALVIGALTAVGTSRSNDHLSAARRGVLSGLESLDPGGVFVVWGAEVPRWADPRAGSSARRNDRPQLVPLGWMQQSPITAAVLSRYGLDDIITAIARGEVYLPLHRLELAPLYSTYLSEH